MLATGYDARELARLLSRWDASRDQTAPWTKIVPAFARSHPDSGRRAAVIHDIVDRASGKFELTIVESHFLHRRVVTKQGFLPQFQQPGFARLRNVDGPWLSFGRFPRSIQDSRYQILVKGLTMKNQLNASPFRMSAKLILLALSATSGCGGNVREDRTISFSADGKQLSFQHGQEGIFVADAEGSGAIKIFQPDKNVIATSPPLASPKNGQLIFATAQAIEDAPNGQPGGLPNPLAPVPPAGRIYSPQPVRYTCWLRVESEDEQPPVVKKLFESQCGHAGYVAAGLVLRWHPDAQRILYCKAIDSDFHQHAVFEFDIETEQSRLACPHSAKAIVFDWTPQGKHLVCVMTDRSIDGTPQSSPNSSGGNRDGIWIGSPGEEKSWWHVDGSELLAGHELHSSIEMLRAARPIWSSDDRHFAFVSSTVQSGPQPEIQSMIQRVDFESRKIAPLHQAQGIFSDLHWSPDGQQLGFLHRMATQFDKGIEDFGALNIVHSDRSIAKLTADQKVRRFFGFDSKGQKIGYVVGESGEQDVTAKHWELLLRPSYLRASIFVADASAVENVQEVLSGMQVTFPLWSPTKDQVSLWLSFVPRYRSVLSRFLDIGLRPGDPAATIELGKPGISWMAVSPQEEMQVGHYHLMKGDANEAWKWYVQARTKMPSTKPPSDWASFVQRLRAADYSECFETICLLRLGRKDQAQSKWNEFEQNFLPTPPELEATTQSAVNDFDAALGNQLAQIQPFLLDLCLAEVYLSVDGLKEAIEYFQTIPSTDEDDEHALSRGLVLGQLLLIDREYSAYLKHSLEVVVPLAISVWRHGLQVDSSSSLAGDTTTSRQMRTMLLGMYLTPLFCSDFLKQLPLEEVQAAVPILRELSSTETDGMPSLAIHLAIRAAAIRLEQADEQREAENRIAANAESAPWFTSQPIDQVLRGWTTWMYEGTD